MCEIDNVYQATCNAAVNMNGNIKIENRIFECHTKNYYFVSLAKLSKSSLLLKNVGSPNFQLIPFFKLHLTKRLLIHW